MAPPSFVLSALFLSLCLSQLGDLSMCHLVKGSVSCLDCSPHHDLTGMRVAVQCNHESRLMVNAVTNDKGYFEAEIPSETVNCAARLLGGPEQLCSYKKTMISQVVKKKGSNSDYTLSTPLTVLSLCPYKAEHPEVGKPEKSPEVGSSKTINLPLPKEWGLAPSSYYVPYFPIIGIP